jgi:hypothetical protein
MTIWDASGLPITAFDKWESGLGHTAGPGPERASEHGKGSKREPPNFAAVNLVHQRAGDIDTHGQGQGKWTKEAKELHAKKTTSLGWFVRRFIS